MIQSFHFNDYWLDINSQLFVYDLQFTSCLMLTVLNKANEVREKPLLTIVIAARCYNGSGDKDIRDDETGSRLISD